MTTIAILSDIHANIVSFETVLRDLEGRSIERMVCLGDVEATGPAPAEVIARLRTLEIDVIRGNCDDAILRFARDRIDVANDEHDQIDQWCATQFSPDELAYIDTFAPFVTFAAGGVEFCCYHGSPKSYNDQIRPETGADTLAEFFEGQTAKIYAGGHTHVQMLGHFQDALVINPGSIGLPFTFRENGEAYSPFWAEYALVHVEAGAVSVELKRIPVDRTAVIESAQRSEMPCRDWWVGLWADR